MGTPVHVAGIGSGGRVDPGTPAADADGFTAVLVAAAAGSRGGEGEAATQLPAAGADEADPALAAALAALLSTASPPPEPAPAEQPGGDEMLLEAGMGEAAGAAAGNALRAARMAGLDPAQAAGQREEPGADAGNDLVERFARELAVVRETSAPMRSGAQLQPLTGREALPPAPSSTLPLASQLTLASTAAATNATGNDATPLRSPVGTPRWSEELGSRLVLMTTRGHHEGSLTLSPEDLGPLEVRISMQQNTAHVWFGAQHADTRAALAEALPRLREMFAEAGLSLGHAGVSQEAPGQRAGESSFPLPGGEAEPAADEAEPPLLQRRASPGLVDLYA